MSTLNILAGRDAFNKVRAVRVSDTGSLSVSATLDTGALAKTLDIEAVGTAVADTTTSVDSLNTKVEALTTTVNAVDYLRTMPSFKSTTSAIVSTTDLTPGWASAALDIRGAVYVWIFYYDRMTGADGDTARGLFVELSTDAFDSTGTMNWVIPEIQILPAPIAEYPTPPDGQAKRKAFLGPLKVAGFNSLRIVHEQPLGTVGGSTFTGATARLVTSSI